MNMQTSSADFRRAITIASKVMERRNAIPILDTVRCRANGSFEAVATDLDIELSAKVARDPGAEFDFAMKAPRAVVAAIGAAGGKTVSVAFAEGKASIASDALTMSVGSMPSDDFPSDLARPLAEDFAATLSKEALAAIARVAGAMSSEETRYYLNGVHLTLPEPNLLRVDATDGHRLYRCDVPLPDASGGSGLNAIVPRKAVHLLLDLAKSATEGVRLVIGPAAAANREEGTAPQKAGMPRLSVSTAERAAKVEMKAKLIDGNFPDVGRVIPASGNKQALFQTVDMRRALAAVSGHSKSIRAVSLRLNDGGTATIKAAYVEMDLAAAVTIACEHRSAGFEIGFNGGYLQSVLDAAGGEEVLFDVADEASPALIRNPSDTAFTAVLMPMRVR